MSEISPEKNIERVKKAVDYKTDPQFATFKEIVDTHDAVDELSNELDSKLSDACKTICEYMDSMEPPEQKEPDLQPIIDKLDEPQEVTVTLEII